MDSLSIGRLHARYVGVDHRVAGELDEVLHDVVVGSLERAAGDLVDGGRRAPWAICVEAVDVGVELDLRRPRDVVAGEWARGLIEAVARAVESAADAADGVVVYRSEHDALRDLVVGVARGRWAHRWAWQQLSLVQSGASLPTGIDVADALAARPACAPAVIASCPDDAWRVIDPIGWILIADAVARAGGERPGSWAEAFPSFDEHDASRGTAVSASQDPATGRAGVNARIPRRFVERVIAAIPAAAWSAASPEQRRSLALLAVMMVAPHAGRRRALVDAVVRRAEHGGPAVDGERESSPSAERSTTAVPPRSPQPSAAAGADGGGDLEPDLDAHLDAAPGSRCRSAFGGVWYLVGPIDALGIMVRLAEHDAARAPELLAAVIARVTGAAADDPAVSLLAGTDHPDDGSADDDSRGDAGSDEGTFADTEFDGADPAIVAAFATEVTDDLRQRGNGRLAGRDLGELWRRPAEMVVGVGTIDVVFALDDVDIDVRALGLDADPGFVWWSGAVVRFDHV